MKQARNIPPNGQPFAAPRVRKHKDQETGKDLPAFVYPYDVVKVRSAKDLDLALDHYGQALPTMGVGNAESGKPAFRYTLEWVYPALRWFCQVYHHPLPSWLHGNGWAEGMSHEDFEHYFGKAPLEVKEWREDPQRKGKRA